MTLSVLGVGFGRTGTFSLKVALETLGIGRCHHMIEVAKNPGHVALWNQAAAGKPIDWDLLFKGYSAAVDWPSCFFWRTLSDRYPESKIILTVRDPREWYRSIYGTIFKTLSSPAATPATLSLEQLQLSINIILKRTFAKKLNTPNHAISIFERHNEAIKNTIAPDRLLVYQVSEGWEPLCRFLGKPIPDAPFPWLNTSRYFSNRYLSDHSPVIFNNFTKGNLYRA